MGMNNWGGMSEYMTKKPKTLYRNHTIKKSNQIDYSQEKLTTEPSPKIKEKYNWAILKQLIVFVLGFVLALILLWKYS